MFFFFQEKFKTPFSLGVCFPPLKEVHRLPQALTEKLHISKTRKPRRLSFYRFLSNYDIISKPKIILKICIVIKVFAKADFIISFYFFGFLFKQSVQITRNRLHLGEPGSSRVRLLSKQKFFLYDHIAINIMQKTTSAFNPSTD